MVTLNVVSDIDGVLCISKVHNIKQMHFFSDFGSLITAEKITHFLLPGVREFFQWLHTIENIRVSFFSAGVRSRNIDFVHSLYWLSFPETYFQMAKNLRILSREDQVSCEKQKIATQFSTTGVVSGEKQKDITKILAPGDILEQTILIDDRVDNIAIGQVKNFLYTPKTSIKTYEKLPGKCSQYTPDGFKVIPYYLMNLQTAQSTNTSVYAGKMIQIAKHDDHFEIHFLHHLTGNMQKKVLTQETHPSIIEKLYNLSVFVGDSQDEKLRIQDMDLLQKLMDCVGNFGGRIKKLCRGINRIYYVAGLLFTAFVHSKKNDIPITDSLFKWQFIPNSVDIGKHRPRFSFVKKRDELYWLGLKKMQEVNPQLRFLSPHDYVRYMNKEIPEDKQYDFMHKFLHQECSVKK